MCDPLEMGTRGEGGHRWWSQGKAWGWIGDAEGKVTCCPGQSPLYKKYSLKCTVYFVCIV